MIENKVDMAEAAEALDTLGNSREAALLLENFFALCVELRANKVEAATMLAELYAKLHATSLNMLLEGLPDNVRTSFVRNTLTGYSVLMRSNMDKLEARMERAKLTEKRNVRFYQ